MLQIKPVVACQWDLVSLGEVMLRLDPGPGRIHTTRGFQVWEGGGEYNVARGLRRCFGKRTAVITALANNAVGRLVEDLMLQGGVDPSLVRWKTDDGVGRAVRNGLNFTERGFGPRPGLGCSDRGHTAVSQLTPDDFDWEDLFGRRGTRWLHSGGIFCGLSESTPLVAERAFEIARKHGTVVSYDLNYRDSLWREYGGRTRAQSVNRRLAKSVDVLFGNEEDFSAALGFEVPDTDANYSELRASSFRKMIDQVVEAFPNVSVVATTLRTARSANVNGWGAIGYFDGRCCEVPQRDVEILDRVGGGDSFASGLIHGLLEGREPQWSLECGVAHGALAMSTPGDTSMARAAEVERAMLGGNGRIQR